MTMHHHRQLFRIEEHYYEDNVKHNGRYHYNVKIVGPKNCIIADMVKRQCSVIFRDSALIPTDSGGPHMPRAVGIGVKEFVSRDKSSIFWPNSTQKSLLKA